MDIDIGRKMGNQSTSNAPVIELDHFTVHLGKRPILIDLCASLGGRAIGLLGPNGAGKTTLLRTLLGFFPPQAGQASVLGHPLADGKTIRSLIGYMPESDAFLANVTAVRFVRFMAELSGLPPEAAMERAHMALFYVGLGEARYRKVGTFSTGMKQMVKLAQAFVHGPRILFLDEPTNGLDPPARKRMLEMICEIRDRGETNILLSSHLLRDVEMVCDEVLILKAGKIAACCDLVEERKANRSFVELELLEPSQSFTDELAEIGCEMAQLEETHLKIVLTGETTVRDLYTVAARHQVTFRKLDCQRNSLQDIFLNAMEDNNGRI
jgi:ABC-2 type transport system ATP-binding protein